MLYRWLCAIALMSVGFCTQSSAEDWPTRPIRAIVPLKRSRRGPESDCRSLIKTPDRISERPPRGGLSD